MIATEQQRFDSPIQSDRGREGESPSPVQTFIAATVAIWFLFALAGSLAGVFAQSDRPPLLIGVAAVLPVILFAICYRRWREFREFALSTNLQVLTLAQSWRIGAIVFLLLYKDGILPGVFALPAGLGDLAIAVTAPFVARTMQRGRLRIAAAISWNSLGLLDLVTAVSLGVLALNSSIGFLVGEATMEVMGRFPLSLMPTFFVPLLAILHLVSLGQIRRQHLDGARFVALQPKRSKSK